MSASSSTSSGLNVRLFPVFREAFVRAGLPYFNPHSFRNTLVQLGQEICKTPEDFKAWSQNLGHEKVLTTFNSYGEVASQRQGEIIRGLATPQRTTQSDADEIGEAVIKKLRDRVHNGSMNSI
jgi:integrase/recombinase XerC